MASMTNHDECRRITDESPYAFLTEHFSLSSFYSLMGVSIKPCSCKFERLSPIERKEAKVIENSCKRLDGHWLIPYSWIKDPSTLPDNREQAERKLVSNGTTTSSQYRERERI